MIRTLAGPVLDSLDIIYMIGIVAGSVLDIFYMIQTVAGSVLDSYYMSRTAAGSVSEHTCGSCIRQFRRLLDDPQSCGFCIRQPLHDPQSCGFCISSYYTIRRVAGRVLDSLDIFYMIRTVAAAIR